MSDKKEPKKNCYIYTRVSTDLQVEEGYSLDEQDRRLHDEAKRRNFFVADKLLSVTSKATESLWIPLNNKRDRIN